jgi:hypothetical protein
MEHAVLNGFLRTAEFKGFFPQQDIETSRHRDIALIVSIPEGAENISSHAMKERMQAVLTVATRDPADRPSPRMMAACSSP